MARAAGMSRESAYRLRKRDPHGLFAAAWDRALQGHKPVALPATGTHRERREPGRFPPMWRKGHELHDTLFPPTPPSAS